MSVATPVHETVELESAPLLPGDPSFSKITDDIAAPLERCASASWWAAFLLALSALTLGGVLIAYTIMTGIGVWGLDRTIGWGFAITNFVFWVGIGHAGTLISAILLLLRQRWRTSIARAAEAMTIFAVMCAGIFPIIHMGRPWLAFWMLPYPNSRGSLWLNFRSPLLWDVFAISTYFIVSFMFWYVGMIPDFASIRDRAKGFAKRIYSVLSLGWDGSVKTWQRYDKASLLLAGLATPLVVSVHTVVSFDFATAVIPGWHTTIFPPYFVAGAVFSGFAMVLTLLIITRKVLGLEQYITNKHLENMSKVLVTTGMMVGLAYMTELFMAWYSGNVYERFTFYNRAFGPYAWAYWTMMFCNVLVPQLFWFKRARKSVLTLFIASIFVNIGMWFERFNIVVTSLHRDYLPSSWSYYSPSLVEIGILVGSFGLFFTCFLAFVRIAPVIAIHEVKHTIAVQREEAHHDD
ncbi:MAG: polysulfide reductase NrfD [Candidatus Latescibacteria bacterium]|jgi:molybdopterin-containing oxidoreductase family membrane subunit|nr:polysulfide reductase NrfD [Candidatus Latescibacterota bacterium]